MYIGRTVSLPASFPRSVNLTQLRFASIGMTSFRRELHPQDSAMRGAQTTTRPAPGAASTSSRSAVDVWECEPRGRAQMQYKNPHVVGLLAHLLIIVVSLPAVVRHWLPSLLFVGS